MDHAIRILLVEDNLNDAALIARELRRTGSPFFFQRVDSREDFEQALRDFSPELIISDHSLPSFTAKDVIEIARRELPDTPIIIVTGSLDEETAVDYLKAGAVDYILKNRLLRVGPAALRALEMRQSLADQRTAVKAQAQSEQRLRTLLEHSSDVITLLDSASKVLFSTQSLNPTLGYAAGELAGQPVFSLIHPDDRGRVEPLFWEVIATPGRSAKTDVRLRHKDGSWRDLEVVVANRLDDPSIGAVVVNYHDVTEHRRAEVALRESEERFRQMAEHITEGFFVVDLITKQPLYVSPTWAEIWGRPLSEGQDPYVWLESVHPEDRAMVVADRESVADGRAVTSTFRVVRPDGAIRWVRERAFPVRDATGRVYRVVGVAEDITQLRQAEAQVIQAQRMEAVGRLAGGVAHDFNNLLTVILSEAGLMKQDLPTGHPSHAALDQIAEAAHRGAALTGQLMAFSRRQPTEPTVVGVYQVVSDTSKMLTRLIGEDVRLALRLAPDTGATRADRGQLEQVLANLAVNARDAMARGGTLTIATENIELDEEYARRHPGVRAGAYIVLAVSDTGTGMTDDVKARLFEPFFTTKEEGKGTGLGLATSYGIVQQSGGHITVDSELGRGTTMKVYLPKV
jgi:PAS domain S-box-containing protein